MKNVSRRTILHGAGVALSLPWLESLAPKTARAQLEGAKRFLTLYMPHGTPPYWRPNATGEGDAWSLSPLLSPFEALKAKMTVISRMQSFSSYVEKTDKKNVHGTLPGIYLTCSDIQMEGEQSGISVDQVIAQHPDYSSLTQLPSLQLTSGTDQVRCDNVACSYSRSISWSSATMPAPPEVDPVAAFTQIVGAQAPAGPSGMADDTPQKLNKSILDAVKASTLSLQPKLGAADRAKLEQFTESVRSVETRVTALGPVSNLECEPIEKPTMRASFPIANGTDGYNKETHVDLMNDLMVMALQCDATRVISFMYEYELSDFVMNHIKRRQFTENGSTEANGMCGQYHESSHSARQDHAAISYWCAQKAAVLLSKMDAIEDAPGASLLDNSIVMFGSCMEGGNHLGKALPITLFGGGNGLLKTNQHIDLSTGATEADERPLRDLYFTLLNEYFGLGVESFGNNVFGVPNKTIDELLA